LEHQTIKTKRFLLPLAVICAVNAACLWPELRPVPDLNDNVLHLTLVNGMANAVQHGQNPFEFWSPEIALGQPIARMYQPMAHAIVVAVYFLLFQTVPLATIFLYVKFLSLALVPLTFFYTARVLEFPVAVQIAAAALAPLVSGDSFGIDYGSYVWAGHGLFPQAVATHFLLLAIGFGWRAIRHGRRWVIPALLLALTGWSNLLYGYVGAVTLCLIALVPMGFPQRGALRHCCYLGRARLRQLLKIGLFAGLCAIPKLIAWASASAFGIGESGPRQFMADSYGAVRVLHDAFAGQLLDNGRLPALTVLAGFGIAVALWRKSAAATFVLAGGGAWLLVYFGRPFWGDALYLIGITPAMPLHRLIGPVQMFAVLLGALALGWIWENRRGHTAAVLIGSLIFLAPAIQERRTYLANNAQWAASARAQFAVEGLAIEAACAIAKARGGRVYAVTAVVCSRVREPPMPRPPTGDRGWMV
jgi:hypothetical protein